MKKAITLLALASVTLAINLEAADKMKALIIDGQNNHGIWPKTTVMNKH